MGRYIIAFFMVFLCFPASLCGQGGRESVLGQNNSGGSLDQIAQQKDLKVGLVLSGGGAKGFAHIGALKVIEEAGVRIDYIAGTSMGAVVGGLYASGYTAAQIDSLVNTINFDQLIQDQLPRSAKTYYERDDDERYALTLPFARFKVGFPSGFSAGQNYYNLLSQVLYHVSLIENFEELPIPFVCIATDIETGEEVTLDTGYLPEAINASAALPSVFSPVQSGNKLLVDGGVSNNYPVEELRKRGVDIVIGVDVQDTLRDRSELESLPGIMLQISNFRTIQAMESKAALTDIYLKPDMEGYGLVDFEDAKQIVQKGVEAGLDKLDTLKGVTKRQHRDQSKADPPVVVDSVRIDAVTFYGNDNYPRSYLKGKLKLRPPETVSFQDFKQRINNLSATDNFDRISYRFKPWSKGKLLEVNVQESKNTQFLRLGIHYDDLYRTSVLLNYTKKRLFFKNDVLAFDFILGDNVRYSFDYYIDKGYYWSLGVRSDFNTFNQSVNARFVETIGNAEFPMLNSVNIDYQDITNQFYFRTVWLRTYSVELGIEHKYLSVNTETIADDMDTSEGFTFENSHIFSPFGRLLYDTLDHKYFPKKGVFVDGLFNWYISSSDFNNDFGRYAIAQATIKGAITLFPKFTVIPEASGGFFIGSNVSRSLLFLLGGYGNNPVTNVKPFLGYDFLSFGGEDYLKFAITLDYEFAPKNHLNLIANYANAGDRLYSTGNWIDSPEYSGYALGYSFDSFLGPLEIKYAFSPEVSSSNWFFSIGYVF